MAIVVAVKNSDQTRLVEEGAELARAFDEPLHVLSVISTGDDGQDMGGVSTESEDRMREIAADRAANAAEGVTEDVEVAGRVGKNRVTAILRYVDRVDARYLVVGGRKRSPTGKAIFGSVTQSVLLEAELPVVTVLR